MNRAEAERREACALGGVGLQARLLKTARLLLGALLLAAALLKIWQWIAEPASPGAPLERALWHGAVCAELLLALWLLCGALPVYAVRVAGVCFALFAAVSLWKIGRGLESCGCFGSVAVSPRLTYWIDCGALLLAWRAAFAACGMRWASGAAVLALFAALQGGAALMGRMGPIGKSGAAKVVGRSGGPWLSTEALNVSADISRGRWVVLVYGSSCHRCLSYAGEYARLAREWRAEGKKIRVALIDTEPESGIDKPWKASDVTEGSLRQAELYRHIPLSVVFEDGLPAAVREEWDQVDWSKPPYSKWVE